MKYYKTCDTLPLRNFFKVFETKNLKYLVVCEDYDFEFNDDISDIWDAILIELNELDKSSNALNSFNNYKEMYQLAATFDIIQAMIYTLFYRYNKQYIDELSMFGYHVKVVDGAIDMSSLQRCKQMSRAILNDIEALRKELIPVCIKCRGENPKCKHCEGSGIEPQVANQNGFYQALSPLIKFYGNLEDSITVAKYIALKNHLIKENGRNKRQGRI